jgi:hypothetical protein
MRVPVVLLVATLALAAVPFALPAASARDACTPAYVGLAPTPARVCVEGDGHGGTCVSVYRPGSASTPSAQECFATLAGEALRCLPGELACWSVENGVVCVTYRTGDLEDPHRACFTA